MKKIKILKKKNNNKISNKTLIYILINIALVALTIVSFIFIDNLLTNISLLAILIFFNIYYLSLKRGSSNVSKIKNKEDFIQYLTFFQIYIKNGYNVYNALKNASDYASGFIKEKVNNLLDNIDKDKSIVPFINFSKEFDDSTIENILVSIYQMIDLGNDVRTLDKFNNLFEKINKENFSSSYLKFQRKVDGITLYPLIGAGIITLSIAFGIISMLGELIYVI